MNSAKWKHGNPFANKRKKPRKNLILHIVKLAYLHLNHQQSSLQWCLHQSE